MKFSPFKFPGKNPSFILIRTRSNLKVAPSQWSEYIKTKKMAELWTKRNKRKLIEEMCFLHPLSHRHSSQKHNSSETTCSTSDKKLFLKYLDQFCTFATIDRKNVRPYNRWEWGTPTLTLPNLTYEEFISINVHKVKIWLGKYSSKHFHKSFFVGLACL